MRLILLSLFISFQSYAFASPSLQVDRGDENPIFVRPPKDLKKDQISFAVEIPKGSDLKFELRTATGQVIMDRKLCPRRVLGHKNKTVHSFPAHYGVSAGRFNVDGDPLDLTVLGRDAFYSKMIADGQVEPQIVRIIGVVKMEECDVVPCGSEVVWLRDWKVLAVDPKDPVYKEVKSVKELKPQLLEEMKLFWSNYKGDIGGHPQTRMTGYLGRKKALEFVSQFTLMKPKKRKSEVKRCRKVFKSVLNRRTKIAQKAVPRLSEKFMYCLERVFEPRFFSSKETYDFFLAYSAFHFLHFKLKVPQAGLGNALPLMQKLRNENKNHYRFVTFDRPSPGTEKPIFEWVKTKDRNKNCPPGFPPQHYQSQKLVPTWDELKEQYK